MITENTITIISAKKNNEINVYVWAEGSTYKMPADVGCKFYDMALDADKWATPDKPEKRAAYTRFLQMLVAARHYLTWDTDSAIPAVESVVRECDDFIGAVTSSLSR